MPKSQWPSGRPKGWSSSVNVSSIAVVAKLSSKPVAKSESELDFQVNSVSTSAELGDRERGAIILPSGSFEGEGGSLTVKGNAFDEDLTRFSLLMFDKLDSPFNTMVNLGPTCPIGLEDCGIVSNTRVALSGCLTVDIFETTLLEAFRALDQQEPGRWSISRCAQQIGLPSHAFGEMTGFRIQLENVLPMPSREVPYEDVINFRERRRDELLSLRHHIDEFALAVSKSNGNEFTKTVYMEKFVKSLEDYCHSIREENFRKQISSVEISFNWSSLIQLSLAALPIAAMSAQGFAGALWTALGASISVGSNLGLKRRSQSPQAFEYLFRAGVEL